MSLQSWYELAHPEQVDSPALLVYRDRVTANIQTMIRMAGDPARLVPHVKTHKMPAVVKLQLAQGIGRFKCATISEAEMLALAGAEEVLLAYQLHAPKAQRLLQLVQQHPQVHFASLVDNFSSAQLLHQIFGTAAKRASVFIDVDNGMHRTGHPPGNELLELYRQITALPHVHCIGLHVYDGHVREKDFHLRKQHCDEAFAPVAAQAQAITNAGFPTPMIIAGGTPTFSIHAQRKEVHCSPGTCLLWDEGYGQLLQEQPFQHAAVLLTRVISKPQPGLITTDLGHKSVASENPINKRIFFLNLANYEVKSQSEEHLVVGVADWDRLQVGDVLYGIPYHICPTCALYDEAIVVEKGAVISQWPILARGRKITV